MNSFAGIPLLFSILGETGCRLAEVVGLRVEDGQVTALSRLHIFSPLCNTKQNLRRVGRVVMQRIANPCTPVRFRYPPP